MLSSQFEIEKLFKAVEIPGIEILPVVSRIIHKSFVDDMQSKLAVAPSKGAERVTSESEQLSVSSLIVNSCPKSAEMKVSGPTSEIFAEISFRKPESYPTLVFLESLPDNETKLNILLHLVKKRLTSSTKEVRLQICLKDRS